MRARRRPGTIPRPLAESLACLWAPGGVAVLQGGSEAVHRATPDSVSLFPSTSAVSRPPWMLTTHPRTPVPEAASTRSSATTAWPSRALPGPSGRGCRQPPSSTSPSRPRPRAIRGPPPARIGGGEGDPRGLSQAPVTRQHCTPGIWGRGWGRGWGWGYLTENLLHWSCLNQYFFSSFGMVDSSPSQAHVQRHVSC